MAETKDAGPSPQQLAGGPDSIVDLYDGKTPEEGVIRLSKWPEGYVLWHHGEMVWRSWLHRPQMVTVTLNVDASEALASLSRISATLPARNVWPSKEDVQRALEIIGRANGADLDKWTDGFFPSDDLDGAVRAMRRLAT